MGKIAIVVGTRPEIIKTAPVIREFQERKIDFTFILTGQHYDYALSKQLLKDLSLPSPQATFKLNNTNPTSQIGETMTKLENTLIQEKPTFMLIQGDTNAMLAAGLTAVKLGIPLGHIEAGLRSYDWRMPEEHNRRMVDHVSDMLFAPTEQAKKNLLTEHVHGQVYVTGNTVMDAVHQHLPIAERRSTIIDEIKFEEYVLVTVHRAENVDNREVLKGFVGAFLNSPIPIIFPIHPRTKKRLQQFHLLHKLTKAKNIHLFPPLGYLDMLKSMKECKLIATDSGGLQEEATHPSLRKSTIVLRLSTERPEAVEAGFAIVVGVNSRDILQALRHLLENPPSLPETSPFGDGKAAQKIIGFLLSQ